MGACATTGGIFDTYAMVQGSDHHPRGRLRPRLPAAPEGLIYGIRLLQKKIMGESFTDEMLRDEKLVGPSGLFLPADRVDESVGAVRKLRPPDPVHVVIRRASRWAPHGAGRQPRAACVAEIASPIA